MGRLIDDLQHLSMDVCHIHGDVEHLILDLDNMAETAGLDPDALPSLADLRDHLKDLDAHTVDVLNHVAHVQAETRPTS